MTKKSGIIYLSIFLCVICAVATAIMGFVSVLTRGPIEAAKSKKVADSLKIVLPEFDNDPAPTVKTVKDDKGQDVSIYTGTKNGTVTGYAVEASTSTGYGGNVSGLIGYDPHGTILKFLITSHNETPGLGTKVTDRVRERTIFDVIKRTPQDPTLPPNPILDQFDGKSITNDTKPWTVKKDSGDIDFISGATISSRAATDIAWQATSALHKYLSTAGMANPDQEEN